MIPSASTPSAAPLSRGVSFIRDFRGLEVTLRSVGLARFGGAAFLGIWLCGWAVGEAFALWFLGAGAWALISGQTPSPFADGPESPARPLAAAPAFGIGAFLLFWTFFWTLGGIAALNEFSRLVWGVDRLRVTSDALEVTRRAGFFVHRRRYPREQLRRVYRIAAGSILQAETVEGTVELTRLGPPADQDRIVELLATELKLPPVDNLPATLPAEWQEVTATDGSLLLVKNPATRRTQARVAWLIALPLCGGAIALADAARHNPTLITLAVMLAAVALAGALGAAWLSWGRIEWRIERGGISQQRRLGSRARTLFRGTTLELSESRDSDGDSWFAVAVVAQPPTDAPAPPSRTLRRNVSSQLRDPTEPRRLARWLAAKSGAPLSDLVPTSADKAAELAAVLRQLEGSGPFGRWIGRLVERVTRGRRGHA